MRISDLMTKAVVTARPDTPLKEVAETLAARRISGLPVVGEEGRVLGVVSEADILVKERGPEPRHGGVLGWLLGGGTAEAQRLAARTAGEAMTAPAITIEAEKHVSQAARLMTDERIKRLPVVDPRGALVGIVTRADLVRAFTRSDAEIEREIEDDVVRRTLLIENGNLDIRVEGGEVRLAGKLQRRSDAELLPPFVARVPGVVAVHSTLSWEWDDRNPSLESNPRVPIPSRR